jgi:hypothetical protein
MKGERNNLALCAESVIFTGLNSKWESKHEYEWGI